MPRTRRPREGTTQLLRIGSHNVRSLLGSGYNNAAQRIAQFLRQWARQRLDIVCLQETRVTDDLVSKARTVIHDLSRALHAGQWTSWWDPAPDGRHGGGTAILIRSALLTSGALTFPGAQTQPTASGDGRLLHLPVRWGGHTFTLLSAYLPSSDPAAQRIFIQQRLRPLIADAGLHVWAADFNFVNLPALDSSNPLARTSDNRTTAEFNEACPGMIDTFRLVHPNRRAYTYVHPAGASRIDRIMVSGALEAAVYSSDTASGTPADHRITHTTLRATRGADSPGPGLPRTRLHFLDHEDLCAALTHWVTSTTASAPTDPDDLINWWPGFKRALALSATRLNHTARTRQIMGAAEEAAAQAQADSILAEAEDGDMAALPRAVRARSAQAEAAQRAVAGVERRTRHMWLRTGERPNPALTSQLRPPSTTRRIPALRRPNGTLCNDQQQLPNIMVDYWQQIGAQQPTHPHARACVLDALRAQGRSCPPETAAAMGEAVVTVGEVRTALQKAPPGRAPGADGLPVEIYQRTNCAPLLAAVFTAVGQTNRVPEGFLDGVISSFFKADDPTQPANYRPITLLGTDYRTLARVLKQRLLPVFDRLIDPVQTAFLTGRRIADSVLLLQLLPALLRAERRTCIVAFLDFYKAYDTLNRDFLYACLHEMGLGEGFITWVRRLHTGTRSAALVNGFLSHWVDIAAGVRQGCPLAPILYLAPAQALVAWLQHQQIGISLADVRLTASQFADDCSALLRRLADVPRFKAVMDVFHAASGQRLNNRKVKLLPLGTFTRTTQPADPPSPDAAGNALAAAVAVTPADMAAPAAGTEIEGFRIVADATTLGVRFADRPTPDQQTVSIAPVRDSLEKVAGLHLSAFGRAFAASGYSISRVMYHWEFMGMPRVTEMSGLMADIAAVVDRRIRPSARENSDRRRAPGIGVACMPIPPSIGGLGLLPVNEHIRARHACLVARGILGMCGLLDMNPLWTRVLLAILRYIHPAAHPLCLLAVRGDTREGQSITVLGRPVPKGCMALTRLLTAFAFLPQPIIVDAQHLVPGAWCCHIPLWGNPLLLDGGTGRTLDEQFGDLRSVRGFDTMGVAVRCFSAMSPVWNLMCSMGVENLTPEQHTECTNRFRTVVLQDTLHLTPRHPLPTSFQSGVVAVLRMSKLINCLPIPWALAARVALAGGSEVVPPPEEAWKKIVQSLGWKFGHMVVKLTQLTVKFVTTMLVAPSLRNLDVKHEDHIVDAWDGILPNEMLISTVRDFRRTLRHMWHIRWDNEHKEAFWRLALDGFPAFPMHKAQRQRGGPVAVCPCGVRMTNGDKRHHFWDCSIAVSLRDALDNEMDFPGLITRHNLWLGVPPLTVHTYVWEVVCLSAISALNLGRRTLYRECLGSTATALSTSILNRIGRIVISDFWARLTTFAARECAPKGWENVSHNHPFLAVNGDGLLLCRLPAVNDDDDF